LKSYSRFRLRSFFNITKITVYKQEAKVTDMSAVNLKALKTKIPGDGRDRGFGGRFKETGGNNPFKKPKFTGDCEDLKECVFDCEDERQRSVFEVNMKKLSMRRQSMIWAP
jgi:hypothetical protein